MEKSMTFNPTPISKLLVTLFLGFSPTTPIADGYRFLTVVFIAVFFALNNRAMTAIKALTLYGAVFFFTSIANQLDYDFMKNYISIFGVLIILFFLPFFAGKFLIATSDVSSIIVSLEKMKFPKAIVIPLAIVFRYFPAFREDKNNIKMAMKMRGIGFKNPVKYLEYVSIPLMMSAINIGEDISKAAETKCIADPCKKNRYFEVTFSFIDGVYILGVVLLYALGRTYA